MSYVIDLLMIVGFICVTIGVYVLAGLGYSLICLGVSMVCVSFIMSRGAEQ